MCIVLVTTAHPSYSLIVLDNRDEFILRPTSRPHWWSSHGQDVLSARDLQRAEQGTWLGVTKTGKLAILTNFHETNSNDKNHPVQGKRSRGGMVTAWLAGPKDEKTIEFVHRLLDGDGVKGVGGFSLICGRLQRHMEDDTKELESLAIISNRCEESQDVPWIAGKRDEVYGLSNASYTDPVEWQKVSSGKALLTNAVNEAVAGGWDENQLVESLYGLLSTDTMPPQNDQSFEEYLSQLRESIFIPPIGDTEAAKAGPKAEDIAAAGPENSKTVTNGHVSQNCLLKDELKQDERPDSGTNGVMTGCYGTQRQTLILVDWDGNVTFRERALWDDDGKPIPSGKGDMKFQFKIEGWHSESNGNGVHMESNIL
jgi:uncharacterized protein with NRDE domain